MWYMDTLSSTEFRKRFARLKDPTEVTVNGHTIGVWVPGGDGTVVRTAQIGDDWIRNEQTTQIKARQTFTPVPKPSQKGR